MAADSVAGTLVEIARDKKAPHSARVQASNSVLDRAGIPIIRRQELTGEGGGPIRADLSKLSDAELAQLEKLALVAQPDDESEGPAAGGQK